MVIKDIEREDVAFISKTIGAIPVSHIDHLTEDKLGTCDLVEEAILSDDSKVLKVHKTYN
jgi:T-complex protein 1 subunit delta